MVEVLYIRKWEKKTFTEQCFYSVYNLRVLRLGIVQNFFLVGLFWPFVLKYIFENVQNNSAHKEFVYFKNVWKFWTEKVLIPHILVTSPNQNVSILFVNNIYIGNISTFWHRKLYLKTCYSSKYLSIIAIFLYYFLIPKCVNTPKSKNVPDRRMCQYPPSCILLTSI